MSYIPEKGGKWAMTDNHDIFRELQQISDDELINILEDHNKWLESKGKEGRQADLSESDLSDMKLQDSNLGKANLRGAMLAGANFKNAKLYKADFQHANLNGANLKKANLNEANLQETQLIGASLQKTKLYKADLQNAYCSGAKFNKAYLREANLYKAVLNGADLQEAVLYEARLREAVLGEANLYGANLIEANLYKADLRLTNFKKANLRMANLEKTNVTGIKVSRGRDKYFGIRTAGCYGSQRFNRFAKDQSYLDELKSNRWGKELYYLWMVFADCGRTPWAWIAWSLFFALYFGLNFFLMGPEAFHIKKPLPDSLGTMMYYSVVTFTTLGFGDVTPKTPIATWWVMSEVILGYIMLGGLISILATIIARRT